MVQLDPRLRQVAQLVAPGRPVVDVGTDHGYLVAHLVGGGISPCGVACDINRQPLDRARQTVEEAGLTDRVPCLLSDGLQQVPPEMAQEIVIAGMGGDLIASILDAAPWVRDPQRHLILQPMTKPEHLRRYLNQAGFAILEERAVTSGAFVYTVLSVQYTGETRKCNLLDVYIGSVCKGGTADTAAYLDRVAGTIKRKVNGLERAAQMRGTAGAAELEEYRQLLADILKIREGLQ